MNKSRQLFLETIDGLIGYWSKCESTSIAVEGVAHSILCLLDGVGSANHRGYTVIDNATKEIVSCEFNSNLHEEINHTEE